MCQKEEADISVKLKPGSYTTLRVLEILLKDIVMERNHYKNQSENMSKQNKIIVAVHFDQTVREKILKRLIVERGFAFTPSDAVKSIKPSVSDIDLTKAYFVIVDNYKTSMKNIIP